MKSFSAVCDFLERLFVQLLFVFMVIIIITLFLQVINRFLLQLSMGWTQEVAIYSLFWIAMLGMSVALKRNAHLTVDFILTKLKGNSRIYYQIVIYLIVISILCIMLYEGIIFAFKTGMIVISPGIGIRLVFVYIAMPFASAISILFIIDNIIKLLGYGKC